MGNGLVGIGTTTPQYTLEVGVAGGGEICLLRNDTSIDVNDLIGVIQFAGNDPSHRVGAQIKVSAASPWASNDCPTYMTFHTVDDGTAGIDERMRIEHNGLVGIGTNAPNSQTSVCHIHHSGTETKPQLILSGGVDHSPAAGSQTGASTGMLQLGTTSNYNGTLGYNTEGATDLFLYNSYSVSTSRVSIRAYSTGVYMLNGGTGWSQYSDVRMKDVHGELEGKSSLEKLEKIKPIKGNYKSAPDTKSVPMLTAQNVIEAGFPEMVDVPEIKDDVEKGQYGLRITEMIPVLILSLIHI